VQFRTVQNRRADGLNCPKMRQVGADVAERESAAVTSWQSFGVKLRLSCIVALYHRSSTLYQID
jgi:hypothetical protein